MNEAPTNVIDDPDLKQSLGALTPRESELLNQAGDRIFNLSRKLADRERELERSRLETTHLREMLDETRAMRDTLSAQVQSLQRDLEREYDERSELRRLLASLQMQLQSLLPSVVRQEAGAAQAPPAQIAQRSSSANLRRRQSRSWLRNAADDLLKLGR